MTFSLRRPPRLAAPFRSEFTMTWLEPVPHGQTTAEWPARRPGLTVMLERKTLSREQPLPPRPRARRTRRRRAASAIGRHPRCAEPAGLHDAVWDGSAVGPANPDR